MFGALRVLIEQTALPPEESLHSVEAHRVGSILPVRLASMSFTGKPHSAIGLAIGPGNWSRYSRPRRSPSVISRSTGACQ